MDAHRPAGPEAYAAAVVEALRASGEIELESGRRSREAAVILSLRGGVRPAPGRRTVAAVLDLGHLFARRGYGAREWAWQNWLVASAARRSHAVIAPSDAVRLGLERYLGVSPERIAVFAARPGPAFRPRGRDEVEAVRRALGLPPRYMVFVGTRSRRKNLGLLARAWAAGRSRFGELSLVLAGKGSGAVPGAIDLGYVDRERLPALIDGAIAWVCPSFYEGSALGALEAMACGTPPIVAATGALPRAVDGAGIVLQRDDPAAWADAMVAVATDLNLRAGLAAAGLRAAAELRQLPSGHGALIRALAGG